MNPSKEQLEALLRQVLRDAQQSQETIARASERFAEASLKMAQSNQRLIELLRDKVAPTQPEPVKLKVKENATIEPFLLRKMPQSQLN